jgi:serine/threonine protein phosphatase PrpC
MSVRVTAQSHRGTERERNEDAVGAAGWRWQGARAPVELRPSVDGPVVTVVADGLGGHPGGDVASALAVDRLLAAAPGIGGAADLSAALLDAHRELLAGAIRGMGSTAAVLVVTEDAVIVGNVGDSRVYELHAGELMLLSVDDRLPGGASTIVTQVLGGDGREPTPHITRLQREPDLRFLLCTDGLVEALGEPRIVEIVRAHTPDWGRTAAALVGESLRAGAPDNLTVAIVAVDA